jgi:Glycosyl transferase family 21
MRMAGAPCTYLLPLRRASFDGAEAARIRRYLGSLAQIGCEILLVDGSRDEVFHRHASVFGDVCRHQRVDRGFGYLNDKVNGIHTGLALASHQKIVLADDDIRYSTRNLREVLRLLESYEVVRPQNFLQPLPWWAKMEAARMLINRATLRAADYPGTCCFRRETMLSAGHYDGDVLFDNEEILRHFAQRGCKIAYANDLFVRKRPPAFRKWLEQRPRQAYEDFGMRAKTAFFFCLAPLLIMSAILFGLIISLGVVVLISLGAIALAARGRARGRAREFFPRHCCLFAPFWIAERTMSTWWALYWFLRHGGYPFGRTMLTKGVGRAWSSGARVASAQLRATAPRSQPI